MEFAPAKKAAHRCPSLLTSVSLLKGPTCVSGITNSGGSHHTDHIPIAMGSISFHWVCPSTTPKALIATDCWL